MWRRSEDKHTILIQTWIPLFVKNLYITVPSGGIECGYFFVFCAFISSSDKAGPKCFGLRGFRAPCEGGLNLSGCSRTKGRRLEVSGFLVEALRRKRHCEGRILAWLWGWRTEVRFLGRTRRGRDILVGGEMIWSRAELEMMVWYSTPQTVAACPRFGKVIFVRWTSWFRTSGFLLHYLIRSRLPRVYQLLYRIEHGELVSSPRGS